MLIPSAIRIIGDATPSLSRRVNANSQRAQFKAAPNLKLIKKGEC